MKTIAVVNQKGGVGKTTTTCNLGAALGLAGKRVLLIDLDPQAHLTLHLGVKDTPLTLYDVLVTGKSIAECLVQTSAPNVWLLPCNIDLSSAELELAGEIGRETILRAALEQAALQQRFDCVLIDCPPSLGLLCLNGLTSADEVLIPLQAEFFALHGITRLYQVIDVLGRRLRRGPKLRGIVLCRYQRTTRLAREVRAEVEEHFGDVVFDSIIRQNVRLAEASSHGRTVFQYDPNSVGATDYRGLAEELCKHWQRESPHSRPAAGGDATSSGAVGA